MPITTQTIRAALAALAPFAFVAAMAATVQAQYPPPPHGPLHPPAYLTLEHVSPYFEKQVRPKQVMLHDVLTIVVQERFVVTAEGKVDRRKNGLYDAVIKDWITFAGLSIKPSPQSDGEPAVGGTIRQTYRSEAQLDVRERVEFRIAATVVDIRPNGNLVLEAHRTVEFNGETWQASLAGIVRPEDVLPNNSILSENVAELRVNKRQLGHVRDSYRRGWLTKLLDTFNPF